MAKLPNLWLKGGSQKLGGVVLYQANGQTLARELAASVRNPRTPSQMEQRVRLANVVAFYRANRAWMAGAFEDKKQTESDYNAFVSANLSTSRVATSKQEANAGAAIVAPYKVTSGSLPSVELNVSGQSLISNLLLGALSIEANTTVGTLSTALINNNNGIREGMQLSVIFNIQQTNSSTGIPYIVARAYELIIDKNSSALITSYMPGSILYSTGGVNSALAINVDNVAAGGCAIILSETTGGRTRVSTQSLVMYGTNTTYLAYTSDQAWAAAITSYGETSENFLESSSAGVASEVLLSTSIASIQIGTDTILPGGEFPDRIDTNTNVKFNLTSAIQLSDTVSAVLINPGTGYSQQLTDVAVGTGGLSVDGTIATTVNALANSSYRFELTINGVVYSITLYYSGGDIS